MDKTPLSLNPEPDPEHESGPGSESGPVNSPGAKQSAGPESQPVMGWCAVGFGVLGIFTSAAVFVPLALICSLAALFMGQAAWAFVGLLLSVAGFLTSPVLLALVGMSWLAAYLGIL